MKIYICCLLIALLFCGPCLAQQSLLFKQGDRVCFVGNSITHAGDFHHHILLYYVTRFPAMPVTFFNCGISGDVTAQVLNRLDADILVHQPTCAVIMIGMNDVSRGLYTTRPSTSNNADTLQRRQNALTTYRKNLEKLVKSFLDKNIRVILQKPSIYDQTAMIPHYNNLGSNDALKICAAYMQELADRYHLATVDYYTLMSQINKTVQAKDSTATIIGPDRIHPGPTGNLIMTYQFLKTTGAPAYVAKITIDKTLAQSNLLSSNCSISKLNRVTSGLNFEIKEAALPFPIADNQQTAISLVPFTAELNMELLQINYLKAGSYKLSIDTSVIGTYTAAQLHQGINLATVKNTPQYQQALRVKNVLSNLWRIEGAMRSVRLLEYNYLKAFPDQQNPPAAQHYLDSLAVLRYANNAGMKAQMTNYTASKLAEKENETKSDSLRRQAYQVAQPSIHLYKITAVSN